MTMIGISLATNFAITRYKTPPAGGGTYIDAVYLRPNGVGDITQFTRFGGGSTNEDFVLQRSIIHGFLIP